MKQGIKREMRRKDRQLSPKEEETILQDGKYGILSILCEDGYPYGLPLSYAYENGKLYFHHTAEPGLLNDSVSGEVRACFTVVGSTELLPEKFSTKYGSVIAFGKFKRSEDKLGVLMRLVRKFSSDFEEKGRRYAASSLDEVTVYEFEIEQMTGKARR